MIPFSIRSIHLQYTSFVSSIQGKPRDETGEIVIWKYRKMDSPLGLSIVKGLSGGGEGNYTLWLERRHSKLQ